jgi:hypothetical protein
VAASTSTPRRPTTSKPKTTVIESDDDDDSSDNFNSDSHREGNEDVFEAEDEEVEDPLEKYEKMKDEIQRERMVSRMFFLSTFPLLTGTLSHHENTSIEEKIHVHKTCVQCLRRAKSRTRRQGRSRKAISAWPACTFLHIHIVIILLTGLLISANGYRQDHAFLKGSNSTLQTHISR